MILLTILIPTFTIILSVILYIIADPTFSLATQYLSDLGAGPNGSSYVFNIGIIITSFIMVTFYVHLSLILFKRKGYKFLIIISFILGILSSIGIFFVGVFPINVSQVLHNCSAGFFFLGGLGAAFFYTITEFTTPKVSKLQAFTGVLVIFSFFIFIVFNALTFFNPGQFEAESRITEWTLFFTLIFWMVEHATIVFKLNIRNKGKFGII